MRFIQVFDSAGILCDEKSRRVSNQSGKVASISAQEIEAGVTIERLAAIGVPVLRYRTQITIHGILPDFNTEARPQGYRSVFRNANGSVGVRYVAIDGQKKALMRRVSHYGNHAFSLNLSSEGLTVFRTYPTKEECVAAYNAFPRDLFCGQLTAGRGGFGEFYVFAHIGAIPEANLWPLIGHLTGIASMQEFLAMEKAAEDKNQEARKQRDEAAQIAAEQYEVDLGKALAAFPNPKKASLPKEGYFVVMSRSIIHKGPRPFLYRFAKRGPALCFGCEPYTGAKEFKGTVKMRRLEDVSRARLERAAAAGCVFEP